MALAFIRIDRRFPKLLEKDYRAVRVLLSRYAPKHKAVPVLSGEWGYSSAGRVSEARKGARRGSANALARMFLTNIANDVPLSILVRLAR
jgi:hypothetical protein